MLQQLYSPFEAPLRGSIAQSFMWMDEQQLG
jgi:hypothetical protein